MATSIERASMLSVHSCTAMGEAVDPRYAIPAAPHNLGFARPVIGPLHGSASVAPSNRAGSASTSATVAPCSASSSSGSTMSGGRIPVALLLGDALGLGFRQASPCCDGRSSARRCKQPRCRSVGRQPSAVALSIVVRLSFSTMERFGQTTLVSSGAPAMTSGTPASDLAPAGASR